MEEVGLEEPRSTLARSPSGLLMLRKEAFGTSPRCK